MLSRNSAAFIGPLGRLSACGFSTTITEVIEPDACKFSFNEIRHLLGARGETHFRPNFALFEVGAGRLRLLV
jgi:hypothetical protein